MGNLSAIQDTHHGLSRYAYDGLGRIVRALNPSGRMEVLTWDRTDNLLERAGTVASGQSEGAAPATIGSPASFALSSRYGAGDTLEQHGHSSYSYDRLGRLISRIEGEGSETQFEWNGAGQLVSVETASGERWNYRYDALGRRIEKVGPTGRTSFFWDGAVLLHEVVEAPDGALRPVDWEFEEASFAPLWRREGRLETLCACEANGAPREWVSPEGYLLWRARYDGLGKVEGLEATPGFECHVRLQGQWADAESGLHYNRFRYYDSNTGRFVSPDPIGLLGGFNLYAFAPNTTGWVDPWGLTGLDEPGYSVYGLYEPGAKTPYYVGISNNADRRLEEHLASGRLLESGEMRVLHSDLTYAQARGHEQALIEKHGTLTAMRGEPISATNRGNKVNSFDKTREDERGKRFNAEYEKAKATCG